MRRSNVGYETVVYIAYVTVTVMPGICSSKECAGLISQECTRTWCLTKSIANYEMCLCRFKNSQRTGEDDRVLELKRVFLLSPLSCLVMAVQVVAGGGAIEMELSKALRNHSKTIKGKQQLIMSAYAKALEIIPRQLVSALRHLCILDPCQCFFAPCVATCRPVCLARRY